MEEKELDPYARLLYPHCKHVLGIPDGLLCEYTHFPAHSFQDIFPPKAHLQLGSSRRTVSLIFSVLNNHHWDMEALMVSFLKRFSKQCLWITKTYLWTYASGKLERSNFILYFQILTLQHFLLHQSKEKSSKIQATRLNSTHGTEANDVLSVKWRILIHKKIKIQEHL